jgi:predicted nucleic acid-binding protein
MKYVVDAPAVIQIASSGLRIADGHQLLAPTLIRSQVLSILHESVARGELDARAGRDLLAAIGKLPIRLLGDGVLRRRAWDIADSQGWASTYDAEYVALTQLQADALVTLDDELARAVHGLVETASVDVLVARSADDAG